MKKKQVSSEDIQIAISNLQEIFDMALEQSIKNGTLAFDGNYAVTPEGAKYFVGDDVTGYAAPEVKLNPFACRDLLTEYAKTSKAERLQKLIAKAQEELNQLNEK